MSQLYYDISTSEPTETSEIVPEISPDNYMKLRCLLGNFETDPTIAKNLQIFEKYWTELHSISDFNDQWNKKKYDNKCFGVQIMNGINDFKYKFE